MSTTIKAAVIKAAKTEFGNNASMDQKFPITSTLLSNVCRSTGKALRLDSSKKFTAREAIKALQKSQ